MAANHVSIFTKKDVAADLAKQPVLERSLSAFGLTTMGVGAIVGAGIFITPGIIAGKYAGPAVILSFLLAAVVCALAALCYAEFASTIPLAGSAYTYAYSVFGEIIAWILGWSLVSEYLFAVSSVAGSWSAYFQNLLGGFGVVLPTYLQHANGKGIDIIAIIIVLIVTTLLISGVRESTRVNEIMVIVKIAVILLFIGVGAFFIKSGNFVPFIPKGFTDAAGVHHYGFAGIVAGAATAFYAYIGFDAVSTASEEVKNPKRDMPIGIIGSLGVASLLYMTLSAVLVGVVNYKDLASPAHQGDPVAYALTLIHQNWVAGIVSLGAVIGMTTVLMVMSFGGNRLLFAISRDGLLPKAFSKVSERSKVPAASTIIFGVLAAFIGGVVPLQTIAELVNIGTLFAFALVSLGIVFLRRDPQFKDNRQGFKVPFYPVVPILSFALCVFLMLQLEMITWKVFVIWQVLGLIWYAVYGSRNSKVRHYL
ncbi:amino acid permease [Periweissella ghanensis]|uniref:Amino acid permease YhdG n=1 Tax=Periweissella ghanensis TaxID=467997 RepID=A0ABM8Z9V2_9LACO|nr:amino acid permease [Periweissella ghanensis]MCM0600531.1 amino acid permease [Periweissella ghanensis]CAH0418259.1 putative amino acid permease YhdG [Periweissella ghanensis]